MDQRVRIAGPDDVAEVARLLHAFGRHTGDGPAPEVFEQTVPRLIGDPDTEFLLAGHGVAQVRYRLSAWIGTEDAFLEDLFVEEHARGTGLGRALAAAAIECARSRGCARIALDTGESNTAARALYESLGFARKGGDGIYMQNRIDG
jgi:GNAT superfamily N-acetyltransferase